MSFDFTDLDRATWVTEMLERAGYRDVVMARHPTTGVAVGADWEQWIYVQLSRSTCVVFLASRSSLNSRWCTSELAIAAALDLPCVTITLERLDSDAINHLSRYQTLDIWADDRGVDDRLVAGLRALGQRSEETRTFDPDAAPYPGLRPFEPDQDSIYFGRDEECARLLRLLLQRSAGLIIGVTGPSGVGKTSLVQAGVVARLATDSEWSVLCERASRLPTVVASHDGQSSQHDASSSSVGSLSDALDQLVATEGTIHALYVVEQAEQLLTELNRDLLRHVTKEFGRARDKGHCVLLTMRSEFLGHQNAHTLTTLFDVNVPIDHLGRAGLRQAIEEPARRVGVILDPGLVDTILDDTERGDALPLLAFALRELWDRREGNRLTRGSYVAIGGVEGALRLQADDSLALAAPDGENSEQHLAVLRSLRRLARVDDRHDAPVAATVVLDDKLRSHFQPFVDRSLIVTDSRDGVAVADVCHEAVLRQWPPLVEAIRAGRDEMLARREIEFAAQVWDGTDTDALLYGERLKRAHSLVDGASDAVLTSFYEASIAADRVRSNRRRWVRAVVVLGVLAALLGGAAAVQWRAARSNADEAQASATRSRVLQLVADVARTSERELDLAMLLAVEANTIEEGADSNGALLDVLQSAPGPLLYLDTFDLRSSTVMMDDGSVLGVSPEGRLTWIDPTTGSVTTSLPSPSATVEHLSRNERDDVLVGVGVDGEGTFLFEVDRLGVVRRSMLLASPVIDVATTQGLTAWIDTANILQTWVDGVVAEIARFDETLIALDVTADGACAVALSLAEAHVIHLDDSCAHPEGPITADTAPNVAAVAFHPTEHALALASRDRVIMSSPQRPDHGRVIATHGPRVRAVEFAPDGTELVTGGLDGDLRTWRVSGDSVESRPPLHGHRSPVARVHFGPDAERLVSIDSSGVAIAWGRSANRRLLSQTHPMSPRVGLPLLVEDTPKGRIVVGTAGVEWPDHGATELPAHNGIVAVATTETGDPAVVVWTGDGILLVDRAGQTESYPELDTVSGLTTTPASREIHGLTAQGALCSARPTELAARCFDVRALMHGQCQARGSPREVAVGPAGRRAAIGTDAGELAVVGLSDGVLEACWTDRVGDEGRVNALLWTERSGRDLIVAGHDRDSITLVSIGEDGLRTERSLVGHTDSVIALDAIAGELLVSGGEDGRMMVWDLVHGRSWGAGLVLRRPSPAEPEIFVDSVAAGDGVAYAVQDGVVVEWSLSAADWITQVCRLTSRSLDHEEVNRYGVTLDAQERCSTDGS